MTYDQVIKEKFNYETELLSRLGLRMSSIQRYRGAWEDRENHIIIQTRTGGENREVWPNEVLESNPYFFCYEDDLHDPTYSYYHFHLPIKKG